MDNCKKPTSASPWVECVGGNFLDIKNWEPEHTVRFFSKDGEEIGEFDFSKSPATFKGNVDESAKLFVDGVLRMWGKLVLRENSRAVEELMTQRLETRISEAEYRANEWADAATNGLQWLRNIRDGISTPEEAINIMEANIKHCREFDA